jgi:DNA-binding NarL/FixJ family response regulator
MNTQGLNLFIIDDNQLMATGLRIYLNNRFGTNLNISTFNTGVSALKEVDTNTAIVILDYYLEGENGNDILKSIKKINPNTEVIMLSSNEDIAIAIDSFRNGATDYVVKGEKAWKKVTSLVYGVITYPVRIMVREWGLNKYIAIFILTFVIMGVLAYLSVQYIP